jgi:hypothetical protein
MSAVRKDKADFKINGVYFFIKSDTHGQSWHHRFQFFTIKDGVVMHKKYSNADFTPMDDSVQKAYQEWATEKFLLDM